jgi:translation initiation factor 1
LHIIDIISHLLYTIGMKRKEARTVWSSEDGDQRKKALTPNPSPSGRGGRSLPPQQQTAYLHRDSKGRGGKSVTLIKNLVLSEDDLKSLAKRIKQDCGVGGTVKDEVIEIQSEQRERIAEILQRLGYKVKIAGG